MSKEDPSKEDPRLNIS